MNTVPESENVPFDAPSGDQPAADPVDQGLARIAELEKQLEEAKKERLLALAEGENASRRADKRIADNAKYAVSNICKSLVAVADNLGRALLAAPPDVRAKDETLKNLATGVELTEKELLSVLESNGVRRIESLNQAFDANFHNAVQEVENTSVPSGTVVQVFQEGYVIHDRLLRPAMVIVSRGGPKREPKADAKDGPAGVNTTA
jgi:molecular chaperone GrpE